METRMSALSVLNLPTLCLNQLRRGNALESKRLIEACRNLGFFYLDLSSDAVLCRLWDEVLAAMKEYFAQPIDVKMHDARQSDNYGYEPLGTEVGPHPNTVDGYESLKVSRREFLQGFTDLSSTSGLANTELFFEFSRNAHAVTMTLLERLSDEMALFGDDRFEAFHSDKAPSLTNLTLLRYPQHEELKDGSGGHNKHTDIGSLTFLLAGQWGLQALSPAQNSWAFVEPRAKHAVINVGDSLRFSSKGELLSAIHRVIPIKEQQHEDRYSIAYFLRIADDKVFHDSAGKTWSGKEWHNFKFNAFKCPDSSDVGMQVLTGMMEKDDVHIYRVGGTKKDVDLIAV